MPGSVADIGRGGGGVALLGELAKAEATRDGDAVWARLGGGGGASAFGASAPALTEIETQNWPCEIAHTFLLTQRFKSLS